MSPTSYQLLHPALFGSTKVGKSLAFARVNYDFYGELLLKP